MVQFNLLPDIKKQYIKAKRTKSLIVTASALAAGGAIALVVLLFLIVQVAQKKSIDDLTADIKSETASLQAIPDLNKILTIQNQLESLPQLHEANPNTSRLFDYLVQLTPEKVRIQEVDLNFETETMRLSGSAETLAQINQFVDTLKFATYATADTNDNKPFDTVISELSRSENSASYSIDMTFDPVLFDNTQKIALIVPEQITTRSTVGKPDLNSNNLFENNPNQSTDGGQQ